jgi:hypothetical protein
MRYFAVDFLVRFLTSIQATIQSKNFDSVQQLIIAGHHSPVGIPGKSWVFRLLRQSLDHLVVHSQVQNGVHLSKAAKANENSK